MLMHFARWLAATPASNEIQNVLWIIPLVQTIHILAIAMVLSSVGLIDLRLLGWAGVRTTVTDTTRRYVPWIWASLVVLLCTGAILITGEPVRSLTNPTFQLKMLMLLAAVAVTAAFQIAVSRNAPFWDHVPDHGRPVKIFAIATLGLWLAIAVAGRWIAYTQLSYV